MPESNHVQNYLKIQGTSQRIDFLKKSAREGNFLPLHLAEDLLCLNLNEWEQVAIVGCTDHENRLVLEDFLTSDLSLKDQNVASAALKEWAYRTDGILWHRCLPLADDPNISQRVSYTLLELAWNGPIEHYLHRFASISGLEEMSPTFLSLLYFRALQWSYKSEKLVTIAKHRLNRLEKENFASNVSIPYFVGYLKKFGKKGDTLAAENWPGIWPDIAQSMDKSSPVSKKAIRNKKIIEICKNEKIQDFMSSWPELWFRSSLNVEAINGALKLLTRKKTLHHWPLFAGISSSNLLEALYIFEKDPEVLCKSLHLVHGLMNQKDKKIIIQFINELKCVDAEKSSYIPHAIGIFIKKCSLYEKNEEVRREQDLVLKSANTNEISYFDRLFEIDSGSLSEEDQQRRLFIDRHIRKKAASSSAPNLGFWQLLDQAWSCPSESQIDQLAVEARQQGSIHQLCYIHTLGRFRGHDLAALKLLDYIRSSDEDVLRAVVLALAGIGTNRAHQELVSFLTRPNVGFRVQSEITQILQAIDLTALQAELRSAIADITIPDKVSDPLFVLKESLASLLQVNNTDSSDRKQPIQQAEDLDRLLNEKMPEYNQLSSEAKRALRTAQFFHLNVDTTQPHTIDLSPAIDMQYKALELTFRECFEDPCTRVIRSGVLQRKLDIIGYARPIRTAMDEFENYIESLPIINSIPFFSRFKLRKMLRAICQFRPGKRFTLDGLKAFALFFLCFGRKSCRYGLENLFPINPLNDEELAEFCKSLHMFQDFRNRAAHEGFHPDASNDLDGIWHHTSSILNWSFRIKNGISPPPNDDDRPGTSKKKGPVIIHKRVG